MIVYIIKLLHCQIGPIILVFEPKSRYKNPMVTPSTGALNAKGRKKLLFSTEIAVYLSNGPR